MKHLTRMGCSGHTRSVRSVAALVLFLGFVLLPASAFARVTLSGEWPKAEKPVSLSLTEKPRGEAIRALADAAGWSIVVEGVSGHTAELHIKDQAPSKVLELLLSEGDYEAKRDGDIVAISRVAPAAAGASDPLPGLIPVPTAPPLAIPPLPPLPPVPPLSGLPHSDPNAGGSGGSASDDAGPEGEDRVVFGNSVRVGKDETVHDLVVLGGSATVLGKVTGDLVIMGGSAEVKKGARVFGDAVVFGGSLDIEKGARIDGETNSFGGSVHGGQSWKRKHGRPTIKVELDTDSKSKAGEDPAAAVSSHEDSDDWTFGGMLRDMGRALTKTAVLWLVGALLLAFGSRRMETLEIEVARRPLRLLGVGFVGTLVTLIAFVILLVTIIGIPFALVGMFGAVLAAYAGVCAVLTAVGNALGRHRTDNVYAHLAIGCVAYLILTAIPYVGDLVTFAVTMIGFGAFVATRGAGLFGPRAPSGAHDQAAHAPA